MTQPFTSRVNPAHRRSRADSQVDANAQARAVAGSRVSTGSGSITPSRSPHRLVARSYFTRVAVLRQVAARTSQRHAPAICPDTAQ